MGGSEIRGWRKGQKLAPARGTSPDYSKVTVCERSMTWPWGEKKLLQCVCSAKTQLRDRDIRFSLNNFKFPFSDIAFGEEIYGSFPTHDT